MVRALLLTVSLTAACYSPPEPDCGFFCGTGSACPSDYHCGRDGVCHRDGTPETLACAPDAAVDAPNHEFDAADNQAPQVLSINPPSGGFNVGVDYPVTVTFDEAVQNVNESSFVARIGTSPVAATVVSTQPDTYVLTPSTPWPPGTQIQIELHTTISDYAGNTLLPFYSSFTTMP